MGCCQSKPNENQPQSNGAKNHQELEIVTNIIGKNEQNVVTGASGKVITAKGTCDDRVVSKQSKSESVVPKVESFDSQQTVPSSTQNSPTNESKPLPSVSSLTTSEVGSSETTSFNSSDSSTLGDTSSTNKSRSDTHTVNDSTKTAQSSSSSPAHDHSVATASSSFLASKSQSNNKISTNSLNSQGSVESGDEVEASSGVMDVRSSLHSHACPDSDDEGDQTMAGETVECAVKIEKVKSLSPASPAVDTQSSTAPVAVVPTNTKAFHSVLSIADEEEEDAWEIKARLDAAAEHSASQSEFSGEEQWESKARQHAALEESAALLEGWEAEEAWEIKARLGDGESAATAEQLAEWTTIIRDEEAPVVSTEADSPAHKKEESVIGVSLSTGDDDEEEEAWEKKARLDAALEQAAPIFTEELWETKARLDAAAEQAASIYSGEELWETKARLDAALLSSSTATPVNGSEWIGGEELWETKARLDAAATAAAEAHDVWAGGEEEIWESKARNEAAYLALEALLGPVEVVKEEVESPPPSTEQHNELNVSSVDAHTSGGEEEEYVVVTPTSGEQQVVTIDVDKVETTPVDESTQNMGLQSTTEDTQNTQDSMDPNDSCVLVSEPVTPLSSDTTTSPDNHTPADTEIETSSSLPTSSQQETISATSEEEEEVLHIETEGTEEAWETKARLGETETAASVAQIAEWTAGEEEAWETKAKQEAFFEQIEAEADLTAALAEEEGEEAWETKARLECADEQSSTVAAIQDLREATTRQQAVLEEIEASTAPETDAVDAMEVFVSGLEPSVDETTANETEPVETSVEGPMEPQSDASESQSEESTEDAQSDPPSTAEPLVETSTEEPSDSGQADSTSVLASVSLPPVDLMADIALPDFELTPSSEPSPQPVSHTMSEPVTPPPDHEDTTQVVIESESTSEPEVFAVESLSVTPFKESTPDITSSTPTTPQPPSPMPHNIQSHAPFSTISINSKINLSTPPPKRQLSTGRSKALSFDATLVEGSENEESEEGGEVVVITPGSYKHRNEQGFADEKIAGMDINTTPRSISSEEQRHDASKLKHFAQLGQATLVSGGGAQALFGGVSGRGRGGFRRTTVVGTGTVDDRGRIDAISRNSFDQKDLKAMMRDHNSLNNLMNEKR